MVRVGKNGGVSDVPPHGDGGNANGTSQSQNKPNCIYDEAGRIVEQYFDEFCGFLNQERGSDGKIDYKETYEYNSRGQLVRKNIDREGFLTLGPDGKVDDTVTYEYNSQGQLAKEIHTGGRNYTNVYTKDGRGNPIVLIDDNNNGRMDRWRNPNPGEVDKNKKFNEQ